MKILATSDLHGDISQYKKLINYIQQCSDIETIFIDGDISVRRSVLRNAIIKDIEDKEKRRVTSKEKKEIESTMVVDKQYEWFTNIFFNLMKNCKNNNNNKIPIYMNMGNADYRINFERLKEFFERNKDIVEVHLLENDTLVPLKINNSNSNDELYVYSLSNVSISNHRNKDWENVDLKSDIKDILNFFDTNPDCTRNEVQLMNISNVNRSILLKGLKSTCRNGQMILIDEEVSLSPEDTLEAILENFENRVTSEILSKTICLMHGPPYGTPLDIIKSGDHVGSIAIRNFLNKNKPLLSIHGHIHESVLKSKQFLMNNSTENRNSISVSIGNIFKSNYLSIVVIDTNDLLNSKRYNL
ncbi:hypothetical protein H8356DRAFT_1713135 [Neocallimastix lanati (nom. inval.)]|jgi:Icc-related predicted phosphoesterase|uniref:Calcineurin-like phosphoesterase domain-containing protein n=1 Tax=Neocallimastix californiae TaxID=1754190 RepID=A0A1Y2EYR7_9FUNG|nr:hypothetical protein H8356DRAFT_1713135 [Neocallimastix sp. JGI-2020a]ORY76738.1 hypothetical protein LY90DRAFT_665462 [Neocallimastix californiae]|eukprot:ORY76738.1 hypothetical protein LY90DRAFT_665462 [Neocallimastix californiae]